MINCICGSNFSEGSWKTTFRAASEIEIVVSLIALGVLLTLYFNGQIQANPCALFFPPATSFALGVILLTSSYCRCKRQNNRVPNEPLPNSTPALVIKPQPQQISIPIPYSPPISTLNSPLNRPAPKPPAPIKAQPKVPAPPPPSPFVPPTEQTLTSYEVSLNKIVQGSSTNDMAQKMSQGFIRNAISRIFKDPLRSFVEVVVNGLDASLNPENPEEVPIGKFGMGFFSIISFSEHEETKGAFIDLDTTYLDDNAAFFRYAMHIKGADVSSRTGKVTVRFEKKDVPANPETGTVLRITPCQHLFSEHTINTLINYLYLLEFYPHARIEVKTLHRTFFIGRGNETRLWIRLFRDEIEVKDRGTGISLHVASHHLFVTSSSTKKGIAASRSFPLRLPELVSYSGQKEKDQSYFLLGINGSLVSLFPLLFPIKTEGCVHDILLMLPPDTSLTLARDELVFTSETGLKNFHRLIDEVIAKTLDAACLSSEEALEKGVIFIALYEGLKELERRTSSVERMRLSAYMEDTFFSELKKRNDVFLVPYSHYASLILLKHPENALLPLLSSTFPATFEKFENFLVSHMRSVVGALTQQPSFFATCGIERKLIRGKAVLFVEDHLLPKAYHTNQALVTSLGLDNVIFAPLSLLESAVKNHDTPKFLGFTLAYRFSEEGKRIQPVQKTKRGHYESLSEDQFASFLTHHRMIPISSFPKKWNWSVPEALREGLLKEYQDEALIPFAQFWQKHGKWIQLNDFFYGSFRHDWNYLEKLGKPFQWEIWSLEAVSRFKEKLNLEVSSKDFYLALPSYFGSHREELVRQFQRKIVEREGKFFHYNERFVTFFINTYIKEIGKLPNFEYPERFLDFVDKLVKSLIPFEHATVSLSDAQLGKIFIEKVIQELGVDWDKKIFNGKATIWPLSLQPTLEELERLFFAFLPEKTDYPRRFDKSAVIPSEHCLKEFGGFLPLYLVSGLNVNSRFESVVQAFEPMNNYWKKENHSLLPCVAEECLIVETLLTKLPEHQREVLEKFYLRLQTVNKLYLTPLDKDFKREQGDPSISFSTRGFGNNIVSLSTVFDFFEQLAKDSNAFEKFLSFTYEIASKKLADRNESLSKYRWLTFDPFYQAWPSQYIFEFYEKGLQIETITLLLQEINDTRIFFSLMNALSDNSFQILEMQKEPVKLKEVLHYLIHFFVKKNLTNYNNYFENRYNASLVKECLDAYAPEKAISSLRSVSSFVDKSLAAIASFPFCLSQLLASFGSNLSTQDLKSEKLPSLVEKIRLSEPHSSHKEVITQCVEYATGRSYEEITFIECLQNSIDAIQGFWKKKQKDAAVMQNYKVRAANPSFKDQDLSKIFLDVGIVNEGNTPALYLEIEDPIGFKNRETLLADSQIPHYSQKTKEEGSVGEMGNGLFQLYKNAQELTLLTRFIDEPDTVYFLRIQPIREKGIVVDLAIECADVSMAVQSWPNRFFGTQIRVLIQNPGVGANHLPLECVMLRKYIHDVIGMTCPKLEGALPLQIFLKNNEGQERISALKSDEPGLDNLKINKGKIAFKFVRHKDQNSPGYVLTNGYPFKPLATFLKEENFLTHFQAESYTKGWSLILPLGCYAPVQSRTKLQMKESVREELKPFLLEWFYYRSMMSKETNEGFSSKIEDLQKYYKEQKTLYGLESMVNVRMDSHNDSLGKQFFSHMLSASPHFGSLWIESHKTSEELVNNFLENNDFHPYDFFDSYEPFFLRNLPGVNFVKTIQAGLSDFIVQIKNQRNQIKEDIKKKLLVEKNDQEKKWLEGYRAFQQQKKKLTIDYLSRMIQMCESLKDPEEKRCSIHFFKNLVFPWFLRKLVNLQFYPLEELAILDDQFKTEEQSATFQQSIESAKQEISSAVSLLEKSSHSVISSKPPILKLAPSGALETKKRQPFKKDTPPGMRKKPIPSFQFLDAAKKSASIIPKTEQISLTKNLSFETTNANLAKEFDSLGQAHIPTSPTPSSDDNKIVRLETESITETPKISSTKKMDGVEEELPAIQDSKKEHSKSDEPPISEAHVASIAKKNTHETPPNASMQTDESHLEADKSSAIQDSKKEHPESEEASTSETHAPPIAEENPHETPQDASMQTDENHLAADTLSAVQDSKKEHPESEEPSTSETHAPPIAEENPHETPQDASMQTDESHLEADKSSAVQDSKKEHPESEEPSTSETHVASIVEENPQDASMQTDESHLEADKSSAVQDSKKEHPESEEPSTSETHVASIVEENPQDASMQTDESHLAADTLSAVQVSKQEQLESETAPNSETQTMPISDENLHATATLKDSSTKMEETSEINVRKSNTSPISSLNNEKSSQIHAITPSKKEKLSEFFWFDFCEESLGLYVNEFLSLTTKENRPLKVELILTQQFVPAFYRKLTHSICINLIDWTPSKVLAFCIKVMKGEDLSEDPFFLTFFTIGHGSSGHLHHELEHARRKSDCRANDQESHGLAPCLTGENMPFEICACSYARHAHQLGIFDFFSKKLTEFATTRGITTKMLENVLKTLLEIEKKDHIPLIRLIMRTKGRETTLIDC